MRRRAGRQPDAAAFPPMGQALLVFGSGNLNSRSRPSMISFVIRYLLPSSWSGSSYMISSITSSIILRRPRAPVPLLSAAGDRGQGVAGEAQFAVFHREEALVLPDQRVFRLGQHADEPRLIQGRQRGDDRQAAHQFGNQAVLEDVVGVDLGQQLGQIRFVFVPAGLAEAHRALAQPLADNVLQPHEGAAADEEDIRGVHLDVLLLRMLPPALRRHVGDGAFEHLQQRLLNAFARDVARDRHVLTGLANLVDLIDVQHASLRRLQVEVRGVEQLEQEVFHVLAHVAGFRERGRVADGERHIQDSSQGARQQRLARSRRAEQEDIRLFDLDVGALPIEGQPFVMVVYGDRQDFLGGGLADHVLVEVADDFPRRGDLAEQLFRGAPSLLFLLQNRLAKLDTLAADVNVAGALHQGANVTIALATKGTKGVLLGRPTASSPTAHVLSCGHNYSFRIPDCPGRAQPEGRSAGVPSQWR